ncbi:MAG TPA: alpha/beta fold hydrolase [Ottowia sp.]|nr:alpha/beta fold hydrolase [Ottowia sp.]
MSTHNPPDVPQALPPAVRARLQAGQRQVTGAGNERVVWHAWGAPEGAPPVVVLHGGSGSWTHWVKNIVPLLDAGRWVLAADMPGFGDSDPPATGKDAAAMAAPLAAGLRAGAGRGGRPGRLFAGPAGVGATAGGAP